MTRKASWNEDDVRSVYR